MWTTPNEDGPDQSNQRSGNKVHDGKDQDRHPDRPPRKRGRVLRIVQGGEQGRAGHKQGSSRQQPYGNHDGTEDDRLRRLLERGRCAICDEAIQKARRDEAGTSQNDEHDGAFERARHPLDTHISGHLRRSHGAGMPPDPAIVVRFGQAFFAAVSVDEPCPGRCEGGVRLTGGLVYLITPSRTLVTFLSSAILASSMINRTNSRPDLGQRALRNARSKPGSARTTVSRSTVSEMRMWPGMPNPEPGTVSTPSSASSRTNATSSGIGVRGNT